MDAAEEIVVRHALDRGWLTPEQLRGAQTRQQQLLREGRPAPLLKLLLDALPPECLPELTQLYHEAGSAQGRGAPSVPAPVVVERAPVHEEFAPVEATPEEFAPDPPPEPPSYALHSVGSVGLATFLGSPLAGGALLGLNYRRLGQTGAGWLAFGVGALATALLLVLGVKVGSMAMASTALAGISLAGTLAAAKVLQGDTIDDHTDRGGRLASRGAVAGTGLLGLLLLILSVGGWTFLSTPRLPATKITIGPGQHVYYEDGATRAKARLLGRYLQEIGFFQDRPADVILAGTSAQLVVSFVVKDGVWDKPKLTKAFLALGQGISQKFDGAPTDVRLCDENLEAHAVLHAFAEDAPPERERVSVGPNQAILCGGTTEAEARRLADVLKEAGFIRQQPVEVLLDRDEEGLEVSVVVRRAVTRDPGVVSGLRGLGGRIARAFGGASVKFVVRDPNFEVLLTLTVTPEDAPPNQAYWIRDPAQIARECTEAIQADPNLPVPYLSRGGIRAAAGDAEGALADYEKAIELAPDLAQSYTLRGSLRLEGGDADGAVADFDRALELAPECASAHLGRAQAKGKQGDPRGALADFSKAVACDPADSRHCSARGAFKKKQGDLRGAAEDYSLAIQLAPGNRDYVRSRAILFALLGDREQSLRDYRRVFELDPQEPYPLLWIAAFSGETSALKPWVQKGDWFANLAGFFLRTVDTDELLRRANAHPEEKGRQEQLCEAHGFSGLLAELDGEIPRAREQYTACVATGVDNYIEYDWAQVRLKELPR